MQTPRGNRIKASNWWTITLLTTGISVFVGAAQAQEKGGCQRQTISAMVSPDDEWVALVQEDTCSDGYFVTVVNDVVELVRRGTAGTVQLTRHPDVPKHESDIFALDEHGSPE